MTRVRSPNYPAFGLAEAIERTKAVYEAQHRTAEPREVVLKHMGYAGSSGRSRKSLSALLKFGLLESVGEDGLRVSDLALNILFPTDERGKRDALSKAAFLPILFREIRERWVDKKPTPESLEAFLVRRGFNRSAMDAVAQAYSETFDLAGGVLGTYDSREREDEDDLPDEAEDDAMTDAAPSARQSQTPAPPPSASLKGKPYNLSVSDDLIAGALALRSKSDVDRLVKALNAMRDLLPEKSDEDEKYA